MDPRWRHPHGLRPNIRHLMILVLDVALLSALARLVPGGITGMLFIILGLSPPVLALLVLVLDRPSPAKYWLAGLLASLFLPCLAVAFDGLAATFWWYVQQSRGLVFLLLVMNVVGAVALVRVLWILPRRCPECGLRAWLPLGRWTSALFGAPLAATERGPGGRLQPPE